MLKKFDYVVMMTGSKASEPITTFLVLGGAYYPIAVFLCFLIFFVCFFFGGGVPKSTKVQSLFFFFIRFLTFS